MEQEVNGTPVLIQPPPQPPAASSSQEPSPFVSSIPRTTKATTITTLAATAKKNKKKRRSGGWKAGTLAVVIGIVAFCQVIWYNLQHPMVMMNQSQQQPQQQQQLLPINAMAIHLQEDSWRVMSSTPNHRGQYTKENATTIAAYSLTSPKERGENDAPSKHHPIWQLLIETGVYQEHSTIPPDLTIPSWESVQALYGPMREPRIVGMETCATYRAMVPLQQRYAAVAGMFNTGTNAMAHHLEKNVMCRSTWQVPWGKHRMPFLRLSHKAPGLGNENQQQCLPIVLIRDVFHWLQSMCKVPYAAKWKHSSKHCPNLAPITNSTNNTTAQSAQGRRGYTNMDEQQHNATVQVVFSKDQIIYWDSLMHFYVDYYTQYLQAEYPRLIVRFEDMVFQPMAVLEQIAECLGVTLATPIQFQTGSSKSHGSHSDLLHVFTKTADAQRRMRGITAPDMQFIQQHWPSWLSETFHYNAQVGWMEGTEKGME